MAHHAKHAMGGMHKFGRAHIKSFGKGVVYGKKATHMMAAVGKSLG